MKNILKGELTGTVEFKYGNYNMSAGMSKNQFVSYYVNKYTKQRTPVGGYNLLMLPEQLRTFIGPTTNIPSSVNSERAYVSIQNWYGEYSLPAAPYVVQAGTNLADQARTHGGLDDKSPIFLKNGYIIVNYNLESIQNGDVVFYNAYQSSRDEFSAQVSH